MTQIFGGTHSASKKSISGSPPSVMRVATYEELYLKIEDIQTLVELADEENDSSLQTEIVDGLDSVAYRLEQMELRLMLRGEFDKNNAILNIHSGAGGIDAQDWAGMLMRMYLRWCDQRGYETEIVDITAGRRSRYQKHNHPCYRQPRLRLSSG